MKIVILGGGYIGGSLASALQDEHEITIIGHGTHEEEFRNRGLKIIVGDVADQWRCRQFDTVNVVIHAAGPAGAWADESPLKAIRAHVTGAANLRGLSTKVVYLSSMAVYGDGQKPPYIEDDPASPRSFYGALKLAGEKALAREGALIVRLPHIYGYGSGIVHDPKGVVNRFVREALEEKPLTVAEKCWDFLHIDDLVRFLKFAFSENLTGIFNVSMSGATIKMLADSVCRATPTTILVEEGSGDCYMSTDKVRQHNWFPSVSLDDGIRELVEKWK